MTRSTHYDGRWMSIEERDYLRAMKEHNRSARAHDIPCPYVMSDIKPYRNMLDGKPITSRSEHREFLKRNDLIEIGNENPHGKASLAMPSKTEIAQDIKDTIEQLRSGYVNPEEGVMPKSNENVEFKVEDNIDASKLKNGDYVRSDVLPDESPIFTP